MKKQNYIMLTIMYVFVLASIPMICNMSGGKPFGPDRASEPALTALELSTNAFWTVMFIALIVFIVIRLIKASECNYYGHSEDDLGPII